jgi:DNA recombination protein RmuC
MKTLELISFPLGSAGLRGPANPDKRETVDSGAAAMEPSLSWTLITVGFLLVAALAAFFLFAQIGRALDRSLRAETRDLRTEIQNALSEQALRLESRVQAVKDAQAAEFVSMRKEAADGRENVEAALKRAADTTAQALTLRLGETNQNVKLLSDRLLAEQKSAREEQRAFLDRIASTLKAMQEANEKRQEAIAEALRSNLDKLRHENEAKLEQMRATVEEKLQGTLEKRLGESFSLVSERLEQVHKGLGEMQSLATGVGDLKRVLVNVKARGGWAEVQLGQLLEDMLTPEQFVKNEKVRKDSNERVEFAIVLPGKREGETVLLPIDAKWPHEDYERLLAAQERALAADVEQAQKALENAVRLQAKSICEKYVHPPQSTDFAIMFLPTEGLYAEVIRKPALVRDLQTKHRVMVAGPSTLGAFLTSLQMGFRTLAIEKRASEVWQVLSAAKEEFHKYGQVWEKLSRHLATAQRTVEEAGQRTRAVERKLREVEAPVVEPESLPLLIESEILTEPA